MDESMDGVVRIDRKRVAAYLDCYHEWSTDKDNPQLSKELEVWWYSLNVEEQNVAWMKVEIERLLQEETSHANGRKGKEQAH